MGDEWGKNLTQKSRKIDNANNTNETNGGRMGEKSHTEITEITENRIFHRKRGNVSDVRGNLRGCKSPSTKMLGHLRNMVFLEMERRWDIGL
jgi:hypothetical protein